MGQASALCACPLEKVYAMSLEPRALSLSERDCCGWPELGFGERISLLFARNSVEGFQAHAEQGVSNLLHEGSVLIVRRNRARILRGAASVQDIVFEDDGVAKELQAQIRHANTLDTRRIKEGQAMLLKSRVLSSCDRDFCGCISRIRAPDQPNC